jgi:disulfide bond formation protein DsbB
VAILLAVGVLRGVPARLIRGGLATLAAVMVVGVALGAYHAGVEWKFWAGPTDCTGPINDFGTAGNLLQQMQTTSVIRCDEAAWRFLGLSLAGYNALISAVLAFIAIAAVVANQRQEGV